MYISKVNSGSLRNMNSGKNYNRNVIIKNYITSLQGEYRT